MRNRFWEKLGFVFDYKDDEDDEVHGEARPMTSDALQIPEFAPAAGWKMDDLDDSSDE